MEFRINPVHASPRALLWHRHSLSSADCNDSITNGNIVNSGCEIADRTQRRVARDVIR